jgi:hypothetical protein
MKSLSPTEQEKVWEAQLLESRKNLQRELARTLTCKTKKQKWALHKQWVESYDEVFVKELCSVARSDRAKWDILNWELE